MRLNPYLVLFFAVCVASAAIEESKQDEPCPGGLIKCSTSAECIPAENICDLFKDCKDGSDEADPETGKCPACPNSHMECVNNHHCIKSESICNMINDCDDWTDELEETCPCPDFRFRCGKSANQHPNKPGLCIPAEYRCDHKGVRHCADGSDEANCTAPTTTTTSAPNQPSLLNFLSNLD